MIIFSSLGIIASIFQLVILREFSFSIAKNELGLIVGAGFWVVFCSLGCMLKVSKKLQDSTLPILASLSFCISITLVHLAKSLIGLKYYEAISLTSTALLGLLLIGPTALIIGIIFRQFTQKCVAKNTHPGAFAKFFAFEAIGFFLGGLAFTFIFRDYTNPLIFSLFPLVLLPNANKLYKKALTVVIILTITTVSALSFELILGKEFDNANIIANFGSGYGPVIAAYKSGSTSLFLAGSLLATTEDKFTSEEFIHSSLSAVDPFVDKDILFIGPPVSGQLEEIAKYRLNSLDCLQINPLIWKFTNRLSTKTLNNKISFITADPQLYLKKTHKKYDAILMNMSAPTNLALNRYFTEEFFRLIGKCLKPQGAFCFSVPSKREILSPGFIKFNSSIINALDRVFVNRLIIPSDAMLLIASNQRKISDQDLLDNFAKAKPKTDFFTIYHFKDRLAPSMRSYVQNLIDRNIPPNSNLNPSGFFNYLILEQSKFYPNLKIELKIIRPVLILVLLLCGLLIIILSRFSKRISSILNIGVIGFTSISLSSIIIILFQLFCATLFWKLSLLIAFFMAGVASGVFIINAIKVDYANLLAKLYLCWIAEIFILFSSLKAIGKSDYAEIIFYALILLCGLLTGAAYPILNQSLLRSNFKNKDIAITIYAADLIGAFLGTIICGILLIPCLGIPYSLLTLLCFNVIFTLKNLGR